MKRLMCALLALCLLMSGLALADEKTMAAVSCLAAYNTGDSSREIGLEGCDGSYTARVLGRLGAAYAETGSAYIRQFLSRLEQKGFFGEV